MLKYMIEVYDGSQISEGVGNMHIHSVLCKIKLVVAWEKEKKDKEGNTKE